VEVHADGRPGPIRQPGIRALLAVLALSANRVVSSAGLIEALWDEDQSERRERNLQSRVWQLRQLMARLSPHAGLERRLVTRQPGYLLRLADDELDVAAFGELARRGAASADAGQPRQAGDTFRQALDLSRGPPLSDVAVLSSHLETAAAALEEQVLAVLEHRVQADLDAGQHLKVAAEAMALVTAHPLRERLRGQVMLAQYRSGRQADALDHYQRTRHLLAEELGIDPGPELRDLHERILRADPGLDFRDASLGSAWIGPGPAPVAGAPEVPRQLPASVRHFAGREAELRRLDLLADEAAASAGTVRIIAITGTGGIGKTALALQWAHRCMHRFPDGQLYVNLRGYDPSGQRVSPVQAIRAFLDALGIPAARIPDAVDAQAALYRSLLPGRRVLIVLDNARDASQIRPLLPASPECLVLVTSRDTLAGLAAAEGAARVPLAALSGQEAWALLAARIGAERLAGEPEAVSHLIRLCGQLPLALAIAAALATAWPSRSIASVMTAMTDGNNALDALETGEDATSIRPVFSWSYNQLSEAAARMFRLVGIHAGPDITVPAAACLAAVSRPEARRLLTELAQASLLSQHVPARFALHDLVREYAAEQAATLDTLEQRRAAIRRCLDYYLHSAYRAARLLSMLAISLRPPQPGVSADHFTDDSAAYPWFLAEHETLLAAVRQAAREGFDDHAWQIPWTLTVYLGGRGHLADLAAVSQIALAAAERLGDATALGWAEYAMGWSIHQSAADETALNHERRAISHFEQTGDLIGAGTGYEALSKCLSSLGRRREALSAAENALARFQTAAEPSGEAYSLGLVGRLLAELGDPAQGIDRLQHALAIYEQLSDPVGLAEVLESLGWAHRELGSYQDAIGYLLRALRTSQRMEDDYRQAVALISLGATRDRCGDRPAARADRQRALLILETMGHPNAAQLRAELAQDAQAE
jgi:DNA-binding SARP family transcriptional activator/tetratricopeptide (TPR) repeat protein